MENCYYILAGLILVGVAVLYVAFSLGTRKIKGEMRKIFKEFDEKRKP